MTQEYLQNGKVICGKIGYVFDKNKKEIRFTYQLERGVAEKSFANQVARQVGIS